MNTDDVRAVVEAATLAPSVHNTQPWRFAAHDDVIDIYADRRRALGVIDPVGRELHISCGAATAFATLAVRDLGRRCTVHLLPTAGDRDHLARLVIGEPLPPTEDEERLARALPIRYTDRDRFEDRPVPDWLIAEFGRLAAETGTWIRALDQSDAVTVAVLLARADDEERRTPGYLAELATWSRDRSNADDGIPRPAADEPSVRGTSLRIRDFDPAGRPGTGLPPAGGRSPGPPPEPEHPLLLVLGTADDDPVAWLTAGQALARLLLRAACEGVTASPLTQVLEVPATRAMLSRELHFVGHPQMLLRMGYGHGRPTTHRRPIDEVLSVPAPRESGSPGRPHPTARR